MRRFLTLICLLGLAIPAGISISGCARNPAGNYCNGLGYGITDTQVSQITLQPQIAGISLAYGQTTQVQVAHRHHLQGHHRLAQFLQLYSYGTTNNQLVDISPTGSICAGTWNRNTGGGIADYTYCYFPNPLPSTNGLPYGIAYITATADSVTSNPVAVYVHAPVTSISLVTTPLSSSPSLSQQCFSQNQQAQLNAQGCFASGGQQYELCAPPSVNLAIPGTIACSGGLAQSVTPQHCRQRNLYRVQHSSPTAASQARHFVSGSSAATITGTAGQTCDVSNLQWIHRPTATSCSCRQTNTINPWNTSHYDLWRLGPERRRQPQLSLSSGTATCSGTIQSDSDLWNGGAVLLSDPVSITARLAQPRP